MKLPHVRQLQDSSVALSRDPPEVVGTSFFVAIYSIW